jgi:hypothetical protein
VAAKAVAAWRTKGMGLLEGLRPSTPPSHPSGMAQAARLEGNLPGGRHLLKLRRRNYTRAKWRLPSALLCRSPRSTVYFQAEEGVSTFGSPGSLFVEERKGAGYRKVSGGEAGKPGMGLESGLADNIYSINGNFHCASRPSCMAPLKIFAGMRRPARNQTNGRRRYPAETVTLHRQKSRECRHFRRQSRAC